MEGLRKSLYRMGIKSKSAGPWDEVSAEKRGRFTDGVGTCGHYDVELDAFGYCRDLECRRDRLTLAILNGEAMMSKDGVLIWAPGTKLREVKK